MGGVINYELPFLHLYERILHMKKIIGIFLLALMVSQLLPIKEVGRLLFNNQIVEEHPVDCGGDHMKMVKDFRICKQFDEIQFSPILISGILQCHLMEDIPANPAQEIHAPPPNMHIA
ncbi:Trafficking protein particle complex subunit 9 [Chitinophaga sp. 180180018-2]|nr:Trafficking protein particle complex subunit 9 [Chitinophaga sp. 212800010-3]